MGIMHRIRTLSQVIITTVMVLFLILMVKPENLEETINTIKNPPVVIAKQANITSGPQQVNNVMSPQMLGEQIQLSKERHELHQNP